MSGLPRDEAVGRYSGRFFRTWFVESPRSDNGFLGGFHTFDRGICFWEVGTERSEAGDRWVGYGGLFGRGRAEDWGAGECSMAGRRRPARVERAPARLSTTNLIDVDVIGDGGAEAMSVEGERERSECAVETLR